MTGRCKAEFLRADLRSFGVADPDANPVCNELPSMHTPAVAFGCMYVMEGATLGGQIISGHVARSFGYDARHGAAFFHSYGNQTGAMWRKFGQSLAVFAANPAVQDEIVAAAVSTFQSLQRWCESENT